LNYSAHISVAKKLLTDYRSGIPFHFYLKSYFKQNKKHGSKDRKLIAALCYDYFRLGFALKSIPIREKILTGFFLCEHTPSEFLQSLKSEWNDLITSPVNQKLSIVNCQLSIDSIFPFKNELSDEIDFEKFNLSFLQQPKLFIRIRPGFNKSVLQKLNAANLKHEIISIDCIALNNSSKLDAIIDFDKEAVIQDYNSQRVGELMQSAIGNLKPAINVWDCCAASGGKSIMAYDINRLIKLTVTDKREIILKNLKGRFAKAGIKNYTSFVADLTFPSLEEVRRRFDLIIADAPCTGSGTWARTPEQLYYFNLGQIKKYSDLQKRIVENVIQYLNPGGYLLYVTCSIFKKENEKVVDFIKETLKMSLLKMEILKGYEMQADTLFAALFVMPDNHSIALKS
jgi:16S rRNA (cytosine967-C5)-methyltransferase